MFAQIFELMHSIVYVSKFNYYCVEIVLVAKFCVTALNKEID